MMNSPGISPQFSNNPMFSFFDVIDNKIVDLTVTQLDLSKTIGKNPQIVFTDVNVFDDIGIPNLSPEGITNFI